MQYSNCCTKNIRDHSKIEIARTSRYNYIDKSVHASTTSSETSMCEVLQLTVYDNGIVEVHVGLYTICVMVKL